MIDDLNTLVVMLYMLSFYCWAFVGSMIIRANKELHLLQFIKNKRKYIMYELILQKYIYKDHPVLRIMTSIVLCICFVIIFLLIYIAAATRVNISNYLLFSSLFNRTRLDAPFALFVFVLSTLSLVSHYFFFLLRWWLSDRLIKATDYIYFFFISVSFVRLVQHSSSFWMPEMDLLTYLLIAASISVRLSKTTAEVFSWSRYSQINIRWYRPIFKAKGFKGMLITLARRDSIRSLWMVITSNPDKVISPLRWKIRSIIDKRQSDELSKYELVVLFVSHD